MKKNLPTQDNVKRLMEQTLKNILNCVGGVYYNKYKLKLERKKKEREGIMKKQKKQFILWDNNIKSIKEAIIKKNKLESQGYTLKQNTITNGNILIYKKGGIMKKKISQYDAEMVADWFNGSNLVHSSIADNKQIKKLFEQSEKLRMKAHKIIVDDNTWKFEFARGNQRKLKVKYNYEKEEE